MHPLTFVLLLLAASSANAEVFRCDTASGTVYQGYPCAAAAQQRELTERLTVVPASPILPSSSKRTDPPQGRSAVIGAPQEPKQCQRLRNRIASIDQQARQRSTERLAEERRKVWGQMHELKCSLL